MMDQEELRARTFLPDTFIPFCALCVSMRSLRLALFLILCGVAANAKTEEDWSAVARLTPQVVSANDDGALAPAFDLLQPDRDRLSTELELRGRVGPLSGIATWKYVAIEGAEATDAVVLNELEYSGSWRSWYFTVGKKIMSWDVGYAFRPLDVIQQEDRRRLITDTVEGVPLLAAESFDADSAWSIVIANPHVSRDSIGREPALAIRRYWRIGAADWYAVARFGSQTHWRGGISAALVAGESLEVHASVLWARHLVEIAGTEPRAGVPSAYAPVVGDAGVQALLGVSWTGRNKVSVLGEIWRDDRAASSRAWRDWRAGLYALQDVALPVESRNGLVAIQARALSTPNLHRDNVFLRVSRTGESWTPSADVLYMPADRGAIATMRLAWRGDRTGVELGWRLSLGPASSLARTVPVGRVAYLSATMSF